MALLQSQKFRRLCLQHDGQINHDTFSPDGSLVAAAYNTGFVHVWFYQTETMQSFSRHAGGVKNVMFSPDSKSVISCGADCKIKMWSSRAADESADVKEFEGHTKVVWMMRYSTDGSRFASCSADKSVRVWNPGTGACVAVLDGHTRAVTSIAYGPG